MASRSPDASRKPVNATRAVVMLTAEPRTTPVSLRPSFLSTATTPKQVADSRGRVICHGRNPVRCPPTERRLVPSTMTTVPARMGAVTRSPSSRMATPVATSGVQVDEGSGDGGADLVDAHEPQEPAGHGADEAREDEEG